MIKLEVCRSQQEFDDCLCKLDEYDRHKSWIKVDSIKQTAVVIQKEWYDRFIYWIWKPDCAGLRMRNLNEGKASSKRTPGTYSKPRIACEME